MSRPTPRRVCRRRRWMKVGKKKQTPETKYNVCRYGDYYQVLSDQELAEMDSRQRAALTLAKGGFETKAEAMAYVQNLSGTGVSVPELKQRRSEDYRRR